MAPRDLYIGFQGLALIQGQIYNPVLMQIYYPPKKVTYPLKIDGWKLEGIC